MNRFLKKPIIQVQPEPIDLATLAEPDNAADFLKRGMLYYARKQYAQAEADLKAAITRETGLIDGYYCLGMVFKAQGKKEDAIDNFRQAVALIDTRSQKDYYGNMLHRLAFGHINKITTGDWNLAKEIWHHES